MSDEYQIEIPPSFMALYCDTRKRLTVAVHELRDRYEICEDLAQHLSAHCRHIHVEIGVDEQEVLSRCHQGLLAAESAVRPPEAMWVIARLAELLCWPHPALDAFHKGE